MIVVVAAVAASMLVAAIGSGRWPASTDLTVTEALTGARGAVLGPLAQAVTFVGSTIGVVVLTAALAAWLGWHLPRWPVAAAVVLTMVGADVLTRTAKEGVGRARPPEWFLVNGRPWPVAEVDATRYRLRLLNASNAGSRARGGGCGTHHVPAGAWAVPRLPRLSGRDQPAAVAPAPAGSRRPRDDPRWPTSTSPSRPADP